MLLQMCILNLRKKKIMKKNDMLVQNLTDQGKKQPLLYGNPIASKALP